MGQLNLDNEPGWRNHTPLDHDCGGDEVDIIRALSNASHETKKDQLIREIRDIENYLEVLKASLAKLTREDYAPE